METNVYTQERRLDNSLLTPQEGQTWGGGNYSLGNGMWQSVPAGYVFSNGQWVSPLAKQANDLAYQRLGYDVDNARLNNLVTQGQLESQQTYNKVAGTAGNRLNQLLQDPSSITSDPGYQFQFNQGLEALNRTAAAKGMLGSGNRLYDLTNYGQDRAASSYGGAVDRLSNLLNNTSSLSQYGAKKDNQYQVNPNGTVSLSGSY